MKTDELLDNLGAIWAPPPRLTVSQWADASRKLSSESSAAAGQWKTRPYQREPMDCFTDPRVHTIVLMVARQTMKTEAINNPIGYAIDRDPGPMLVVQFRDTDVKKWTKIRLRPMLRDTPVLRAKVSEEKSRSGANTLDYISFPGGHLSVVASSSPGNLAALPIRYLFCDEIDKYKESAMGAGDPISLAQGRQEEFWNRKTILACTPTIAGMSRIADAYALSDQREYEVPCKHCGEFQILRWGQVKWDSSAPREKQASTARYECAHCGARWNDPERWAAIRSGKYRATAPFNGVAGFRLSGLCRLGTKLSALVEEFLAKHKNPEQYKTFVNEQLAELWEEKGEAPEWEKVAAHSADYSLGEVPDGVRFLTAGVDVQADRLEAAIYGWGRGKRRWLVDYIVIDGSPSKSETWDALTEQMNVSYPTPAGVDLSISRVVIDSGYEAVKVYEWARRQGPGRVLVAKGYDHGVSLLGTPTMSDTTSRGKKAKFGVKVWPINVSMAKQELYGQIRLEMAEGATETPAGWITIPDRGWVRPTREEFCRQLVAEQFVVRIVKGYKKGEWIKVRERNEALDTANLNRAGSEHFGISRMGDRDWARLDAQFGVRTEQPKPAAVAPQPAESPAAQLVPAVARQSGFSRKPGGWFSR